LCLTGHSTNLPTCAKSWAALLCFLPLLSPRSPSVAQKLELIVVTASLLGVTWNIFFAAHQVPKPILHLHFSSTLNSPALWPRSSLDRPGLEDPLFSADVTNRVSAGWRPAHGGRSARTGHGRDGGQKRRPRCNHNPEKNIERSVSFFCHLGSGWRNRGWMALTRRKIRVGQAPVLACCRSKVAPGSRLVH